MISFIFTDSDNERYNFSFGWPKTCTVVIWPQKWDGQSLAMCSFKYDDKIIIEDESHESWVKEFLSPEAQVHINKLIKNLVFA